MSIVDAFDNSKEKQNKSHLRNIIRLANADGVMDPRELERIRRVARFLGVTPEETDEILANPTKGEFYSPATKEERLERLVGLMRIVLADGVVSDAESKLMRRISIGLGISEEKIDGLLEKGFACLEDGLDADDTVEALMPLA